MKKLSYLGLVLALGSMTLFSACSNKGGKESADTDSAAATQLVEDAAPMAQTDSLALIFQNPEKKSEVATDSTYAETPSGLKYLVVREGSGKTPTAEDDVTVHYTGKLITGEIFDSSVSRGEPATFPLNRVIPGWTEGLQLMKEGGKTIFYIPSNLAYGSAGAPPMIGPDQDLIFEVDLIKVGK